MDIQKQKRIKVINKKMILSIIIVFSIMCLILYLMYGRNHSVSSDHVQLQKTDTNTYKSGYTDSEYIKEQRQEYSHKQEKNASKMGYAYLSTLGSVNAIKVKSTPSPKVVSAYDWQKKQEHKKIKPKKVIVKKENHDSGIHLSDAFNKELAQEMKEDKKQVSSSIHFTNLSKPIYAATLSVSHNKVISYGSITAGTTLYGTLDNKINTDFKDNPAVATIKIGKFAGAKLIGKVGNNTEWVTGVSVIFSKMIFKGLEFPIKAIATNADYQPNLYDDVNNHWFQRIGGLVAGASLGAAKGAAKPYMNANQPAIIIPNSGASQTLYTQPDFKQVAFSASGGAASSMSSELEPTLKRMWNRPATVTVNAGHAIGLLFVNSVSLEKNIK
jgi:type IV secretory pathway VirB10-like protein